MSNDSHGSNMLPTNTSAQEYAIYVEANVHLHWKLQPGMSRTAHNLFGLAGVAIFILSIAGNLCVLFLFARFRSLRSFSNLFVLNLTIADFLLCIGNIPMFITSSFSGYWVFGNIGCKIYAFIGSVSSFASINTLALIALDRCMVIVKSLPSQNRMSGRTFVISIFSIWVYSVIWGATPFIGFGEYILEGTNTSCTFDFLTRTYNTRLYVISIVCAHFVIPMLLIICSYSMIFKAIAQHKQQFAIAKKIYGEEEVPIRMRKHNTGLAYESKAARASIIVITVFCVSWTPYAIVSLIASFGDVQLVTRLGSGIPCLLAKFSTVMNPLIYALLHPKFRMKLVNLGLCADRYPYRISLFRRSADNLRSQRSDRKGSRTQINRHVDSV